MNLRARAWRLVSGPSDPLSRVRVVYFAKHRNALTRQFVCRAIPRVLRVGAKARGIPRLFHTSCEDVRMSPRRAKTARRTRAPILRSGGEWGTISQFDDTFLAARCIYVSAIPCALSSASPYPPRYLVSIYTIFMLKQNVYTVGSRLFTDIRSDMNERLNGHGCQWFNSVRCN